MKEALKTAGIKPTISLDGNSVERRRTVKTWQEYFGLVKDMYGVWHGTKAQVESFAELTRTRVHDGCAVYQGETYYFGSDQ